MADQPQSRLFQTALGPGGPPTDEQAREFLRTSYLATRDRAALLAQDINASLPNFTVHDETHLDALWEMADLVSGSDIELNGAEAYVLGVAILIHDLGLAIASYPAGPDALHAEPLWSDTVIRLLRSRLGRLPTDREREQIPPDVLLEAERDILRSLHATHAEELAKISWQSKGTDYYLIDEPELRESYGSLIGKLAHSHCWPTDQLAAEFAATIGASPQVPVSWHIEPLKLACLLRAADAAHLDARRAPGFLRALRQPSGEAVDHWTFQAKLNRPYLAEDRLTYTSTSPFPAEDANAWWMCRDTLTDVDTWLREVDALLADLDHDRLAARGVTAIDDPTRLAQLIRTDGWQPIDASLHVSDVAALVKRLGGEQLYGPDIHVPLRELVQNAADAVRARRILDSRPSDWGHVKVTLSEQEGDWILTIEDSGVGMSDEVLAGALVDFGNSFWSSQRLSAEFPGLLAGGFNPTGQYGIGFFSVFMLGDSVRVLTRPYRMGDDATRVLEFRDGLGSRPLLRFANDDERLQDGGTQVSICLREHPSSASGLLGTWDNRISTLHDLCAWICPTLDVDITANAHGDNRRVVTAGDWVDLIPGDLRRRINGRDPSEGATELVSILDGNMRPLTDDGGNVVGRAMIVPHRLTYGADGERYALEGVVSVGGLRSTPLQTICGILLGRSARAARDIGIPVVSDEELGRWATEQADLLSGAEFSARDSQTLAEVVERCGGYTGDLLVANTSEGWLTADGLARWALDRTEIVICYDAAINAVEIEHRKDVELADNVIATEVGWPGIHGTRLPVHTDWPPQRRLEPGRIRGSLADLAVRIVAQSWDISVDQLVERSLFSNEDQVQSADIGVCAGESVQLDHVEILRRQYIN